MFQGEAEVARIKNKEETVSEYYKKYMTMHNNLKKDTGVTNGFMVYTAHVDEITDTGYKGVQAVNYVQKKLINNHKDIHLASTLPYRTFMLAHNKKGNIKSKDALAIARLTKCFSDVSLYTKDNDGKLSKNNSIHFNSAALSQIGYESALNAAKITNAAKKSSTVVTKTKKNTQEKIPARTTKTTTNTPSTKKSICNITIQGGSYVVYNVLCTSDVEVQKVYYRISSEIYSLDKKLSGTIKTVPSRVDRGVRVYVVYKLQNGTTKTAYSKLVTINKDSDFKHILSDTKCVIKINQRQKNSVTWSVTCGKRANPSKISLYENGKERILEKLYETDNYGYVKNNITTTGLDKTQKYYLVVAYYFKDRASNNSIITKYDRYAVLFE